MEITVHQAIFGENNNRHAMICSSLNDKDLLNELEFSTDRPLSTGSWPPYTTGFPLKQHYVLLRIASDKRPQQRSGWRIVHALIFQKQEVSHWRNLMQLIQLLPENPIRVETLLPLKIIENEIDDVITPAGYSKLVSLLVKPTRSSKILVWVGNEGYLEAICRLWYNLWASVRVDISFTYSYRPQDVDSNLTLVSTPVEYIDQWRGYNLVRNTDVKEPSLDIERFLLGQGNIQHLEAFIQDAGIDQVTLSKIGLIHQAYEYYSTPDWESLLHIVRPLARLIAEIVPNPKSGSELKTRIIEHLHSLTIRGGVDDILALRNFDPAPFQKEDSFLASTIRAWSTHYFASFQTKHSAAIARLLEGRQPTNRTYWNESVNQILQSILKTPSSWNNKIAEIIWKVWSEKPALAVETASFLGNERSIESYLVSTCPLKITEKLGKTICALAVSKSWFRLHAAVLAGYADIHKAFQQQLQIDTASKYIDGMRELVTRYVGFVSVQTVLNVLLESGDQRSLIVAGELCAQHPSLLQGLDLSNAINIDIWQNAITYKEVLLNNTIVSSKEIYRVLDAWLEGKNVRNSVLEKIGYSPHNDLTEYVRRPNVWRPLERISYSLVKSYLTSTARGWLSRFWKGETWGTVLEHPLENAIKESSYLRELLASSDPKVIQFGLRLFSFLANQLGSLEFREWFLEKQFYRKITPENAVLIGKFIADNRWSYTAQNLEDHVKRNPQSNWSFALEEYRNQRSERRWVPFSNNRPVRYQIESENKRMVNVLFLATNPTNTARLRLDKEHREIVERLRLAQADKFIQTEVRGAIRPNDLQEYLLQFRPHVVHFSGHGDENGRILLEDEIGKNQPIPIEALTNLFYILKDNVQVILINACWSKAQAEALVKNINYVIGMSRSINDESAIEFAKGFYRGLGYGLTVKKAFDLGKNNLELQNHADSDVPQILVRPGVDEARPIFVPN